MLPPWIIEEMERRRREREERDRGGRRPALEMPEDPPDRPPERETPPTRVAMIDLRWGPGSRHPVEGRPSLA